jgi:glucose-6-phosphate isomerase
MLLDELRAHANAERDLRKLVGNDHARAEALALPIGELWLDLSKQPLTMGLLDSAAAHADSLGLREALDDLFAGRIVNPSENRPALHPLLRAPSPPPHLEAQHRAMRQTRQQMAALADRLAGDGISVLINLGIGGSDLGPKLAYEALRHQALPDRELRFVANVDGAALETALVGVDPKQCAFVLASKSFGTQETRINAASAQRWMAEHGLSPAQIGARLVALTAKPDAARAFGVRDDHILAFDEAIGGRYSLWSAIGFPLVFVLGSTAFETLLAGAAQLDRHVREQPWQRNGAFLLALTELLHRVGYRYPAQSVVAYDERLARLPEYLQQLVMESNGKSIGIDGSPLTVPAAPVIWGGVGTSVQHAFFQSLHQGTDIVPVTFVAARVPDHRWRDHHPALLANLAAQSAALMRGRSFEEALGQESDPSDPAAIARARQRVFAGNRPSTTIIVERLTPAALGTLVALYEHQVYLVGRLLGINSFDQWGVELGKELCGEYLPLLSDPSAALPASIDASTLALLRRLRA